MPAAGSAYTYSYVVLGETLAWIVGWSLILEYSLVVSTVAVGWSGYTVGFLKSIGPVSYTHLDVYKRQVPVHPVLPTRAAEAPQAAHACRLHGWRFPGGRHTGAGTAGALCRWWIARDTGGCLLYTSRCV